MSVELTPLPVPASVDEQKNPLRRESSDDLLRSVMGKLNKAELLKLNIMLISGQLKACYCDTPNLKDVLIGINTATFTREQVIDILRSNTAVPYVEIDEANYSDQYLALLYLLRAEMGEPSGNWRQIIEEGMQVDSVREGARTELTEVDHTQYDAEEDIFSRGEMEPYRDDQTPSTRKF